MKTVNKIVLVVVLCVIYFSTWKTAQQKDGLLHIWFLDVGQGDAIFIEAPNGNQILIDGGPDNSVLASLGRIMPFWDREIDMVLLSHPHSDHLSGLIDVLERYKVSIIGRTPIVYASSEFRKWEQSLQAEGANVIDVSSGQKFDLGSGASIEILHPNIYDQKGSARKPNEDSVVAKLIYGETEILFTGDLEASVERGMVVDEIDLIADVLKVPHHGSKYGLEDMFLRAVSPQVAIISVAEKNRYGHPAQVILDKLEKSSVSYYRTDTGGDIELVTDGKSIRITSQK